ASLPAWSSGMSHTIAPCAASSLSAGSLHAPDLAASAASDPRWVPPMVSSLAVAGATNRSMVGVATLSELEATQYLILAMSTKAMPSWIADCGKLDCIDRLTG